MQRKDETWGGTSADTLKKRLLLQGFSTWDEAAKTLCGQLTKVQLRINPPQMGAPVKYLTAILDTTEYFLRLTKGFSADDVEIMSKGGSFKGLEYDWEAEYQTLLKNNITPRYIFPGKQWLIDAIGRGTTEGPQKLDSWMCFTLEPDENGNFTIPLSDGSTQGYHCDKFEGPFLDSYTMAEVMKRYGIKTIDLWPPVTSYTGREVQPQVDAGIIPENPKDYGIDVLPQQPILPDTTLQDWVIYEVAGGWLHVGTREEFNAPLPGKSVIWGGTSEEMVKKTLLDPPNNEKYFSFEQALDKLCGGLTEVTAAYHPGAEPTETINGNYKGNVYVLRIDRGADGGSQRVHSFSNYNYWDVWNKLAGYDITPKRKFAPSKLVHVTGYGTYDGPQKADRWMLVSANAVNPDGKGMVLADGMGGTMGYSIDFASPEVKSNYELSPVLRNLIGNDEKLKSILGSIGTGSLAIGIRPDEVPDNPRDYGTEPERSKIIIKEVIPDQANQGDSPGVVLVAKGIDNGCKLNFGDQINIINLVYGGSSAQAGFDLWYCTLKIKDTAEPGIRSVEASNANGGQFSLQKGFEVVEKSIGLCPFLKLIDPNSADNPTIAADCRRYKEDQEIAINKMKLIAKKTTGLPAGSEQDKKKREIWKELHDARIEMETAGDFYWENMGTIMGDLTEEQISDLSKSLQ